MAHQKLIKLEPTEIAKYRRETLRTLYKKKGVELRISQASEVLAKYYNYKDYNTMRSALKEGRLNLANQPPEDLEKMDAIIAKILQPKICGYNRILKNYFESDPFPNNTDLFSFNSIKNMAVLIKNSKIPDDYLKDMQLILDRAYSFINE